MKSHYLKAELVFLLLNGLSVAYAQSGKADTQAPSSRPASDGLLQRIEERAGRTFSPDERSAVTDAIRTMVKGLKNPRENFVGEISRISGVSKARIWEMMPRVGGPLNQDKNIWS